MGSDLIINATLTIKTCFQGHFWAGPNWARSVSCPYCQEVHQDALRELISKRDKQISSLKGRITKLKRYK